MPTPERIDFLGVTFDVLTVEGLMDRAVARDPEASFGYVATPNVDHIVKLHRRPEALTEIYRDAAYTVCDSRILSFLAGRAGLSLPPVPGSDFTARFLREAVKPDDPVLLIGGSAEQVERLKAQYGLTHVLHFDAPMNLARDAAARSQTAQFVIEHPARYIFFALGSPQQEMIAHEVWRSGRTRGLGLCIGASIDFLTGKAKRAPLVLRKLKLEWLHRLVREPRRMWRRYLVDDIEVFGIYRRWRRQRSL